MHSNSVHATHKVRSTLVISRSFSATSKRQRHQTFGQILRASNSATFDPLLPQLYVTYGAHKNPTGAFPVVVPSHKVTLPQIKDSIPRDPKKQKKKTTKWSLAPKPMQDFGLKSQIPETQGRTDSVQSMVQKRLRALRVLSLDSKERFPWFVNGTDRLQTAESWVEIFGRTPIIRKEPVEKRENGDVGENAATFVPDATQRATAYPHVASRVHPPLYITTMKQPPSEELPDTPVYGRVLSRGRSGWNVGIGGIVGYLPDSLMDPEEGSSSFTTADGGWYLNIRMFYLHGLGFDADGRPSIVVGTIRSSGMFQSKKLPWTPLDLATKRDWLRKSIAQEPIANQGI